MAVGPPVGLVVGLVLLTDPGSVDGRVFLVTFAIAAPAATPWALGVLVGRVRRWRVVVDADGVTYCGLRQETRLPWPEVTGTGIERKPVAGLRIHRRGAQPGPVLMAMVFTVPMDQVADEIERRRPT